MGLLPMNSAGRVGLAITDGAQSWQFKIFGVFISMQIYACPDTISIAIELQAGMTDADANICCLVHETFIAKSNQYSNHESP